MSSRTPIPDTLPVEGPAEVVRVEVMPGKVRQVAMPAGATMGRKLHYEVTLEPVPGVPGLWKEVRKVHVPLVKLTEAMEGLEGTGLTRRDVLVLAHAGMIEAYRPGLQTTEVNPASVWAHLERTRLGEDGGPAAEFWGERDHVRAFSEASQEITARGLVSREAHREAREREDGQSFLNL